MRKADIERNTKETEIRLSIDLDGAGKNSIDTGVGFLDHMLELFSAHGLFDLTVSCRGDTRVDDHHTTEDVGICLGKAFREALGDRRGICRYGWCALPMDEALILTAVDLSGRSCLRYDLGALNEKVGTFDTELVEEFLNAFVREAAASVHVRKMDGTNCHHIIEGTFKSLARSLRQAVSEDPRASGVIPSTKGTL